MMTFIEYITVGQIAIRPGEGGLNHDEGVIGDNKVSAARAADGFFDEAAMVMIAG